MIGPKDILNKLNYDDYRIALSKMEEKMNALSSNNVMIDANGAFFDFVITGEYSTEVKNMLEDEAQKHGWLRVICTNSSENNERPGLMGIKLYFK